MFKHAFEVAHHNIAKMTGKKSPSWNFFCVINNAQAKCNFCGAIASTKSGSTGNLRRHVKAKHPSISLTKDSVAVVAVVDSDEEVVTTDDAVIVAVQVNADSAATGGDSAGAAADSPSGHAPAVSSAGGDASSSSDLAKKAVKVMTTQSRITNFSHRPVSKSTKNELDQALLDFVVKDFQAFSLVEQKSFRRFVKKLNPGYTLPARNTLANSMMAGMYGQMCGQIKADLNRTDAVCLTTDTWTSRNNESYIAVTCHYVDVDNEALKCVLLGCFLTTDRHTADNLARDLGDIMMEWDVQQKVVAIATDNAPNIVSAVVCKLKKKHIPCFAHTLNLAVQDGLSAICDLHNNIKDIVGHFKRSTVSANKLAMTQVQKGKAVLRVKQSVPTRWNSALNMFQRLLQVILLL